MRLKRTTSTMMAVNLILELEVSDPDRCQYIFECDIGIACGKIDLADGISAALLLLHLTDLALKLLPDLILSCLPAFIKTYGISFSRESCNELRIIVTELGEIKIRYALDIRICRLLTSVYDLIIDESLIDSLICTVYSVSVVS